MGFWSKLFGRRSPAAPKKGRCIRCGKEFSSPDELQDPLLGTGRFPGGTLGVLAEAAKAMAVPAHACPQCSGKLCLGCSPMAGRPTCPKCGCEMD